MRVSSNAGEQYLSGTDDYVESEFRISVSDSMDTRFYAFRSMIEVLDDYAKRLYVAVSGYYRELQSVQGEIASGAVRKFWELLEQRSQGIIDLAFGEEAASDESIVAEQKHWQRIVFQIYNESCPNITARQLTAWVKCTPNFKKKEGKKNGK